VIPAFAGVLADEMMQDPVAMPVGQLGTPNLNATTLLCNVYQGLNSVTPLALAGEVEAVTAKVTWALAKLDAAFTDTLLGCPKSTISPNFLYPNHTGDALDPPPHVIQNTGRSSHEVMHAATPFANKVGRKQHLLQDIFHQPANYSPVPPLFLMTHWPGRFIIDFSAFGCT
jgi:hypothetical protein